MAVTTAPERLSINLRTDATSRALIGRAAEALGKNRSGFMFEAARREATSVLLDRRFFLLDGQVRGGFTKALDASPSDSPRLRRLLRTRAPLTRRPTRRSDTRHPAPGPDQWPAEVAGCEGRSATARPRARWSGR